MTVIMPEDLPRPPRYATRPDPRLRNRLQQVEKIAAVTGRPLLPWQRYAAQIVTEMNPPGSRLLWRWQTVVILVPRQAGKTTLMRSILADRCITNARTQVVMSAQLGKDSSDRWEDLVSDLEESPLKPFLTVKRGKGDQRCTFPNGSRIAPFTPTRDGVHGKSPNTGLIDEAWAFTTEDMEPVLIALNPAMITKHDRQLIIISAAGDTSSTWLNEMTDRLRVEHADPRSTTAFLEWSADPAADPRDPATWDFHPGLDRLITHADLAGELAKPDMTLESFKRSYLNLRTVGKQVIVDLDKFDARAGVQDPPESERLVLAYDVALDRSQASIWSAWLDADGRTHLHHVETAPGADWLAARMIDLNADLTPAQVVADDGGPARVVTDQLRRAGMAVETLSGRDSGTAWTALKAIVHDDTGLLIHDGHPGLRQALELAAETRRGDIAILSRKDSLGPIDAAYAATVAAWFAARANIAHLIF